MSDYQIRLLQPADEPAFRPVRLAALRLHPEAFSANYEDEQRSTPDELAARLLEPPSFMFGGFAADGALVGTTGLRLQHGAKTRHKAGVFAVYVDAAHRHTGLAQALVEAAIAHARGARLSLLLLTATLGNHAAIRLYIALGFRCYGIERRGLCVDGMFHDELLMALDLD
jgi:RimJ/RimL family protein N-acetyltransferase